MAHNDQSSASSAPSNSTYQSITDWIADHKLRSVGMLWLSGLTASLAYNWSKPLMKPSVKLMHARVHSQALTLAALAGAAAVEIYDRKIRGEPEEPQRKEYVYASEQS